MNLSRTIVRSLLLLYFGITTIAQAGKSLPPKVDLTWFYEALRNADQMEFLEGLPHQRREVRLREQEMKRHQTIQIAEEFFYEQRLPCSEEFRSEMTSAFLEKKLFAPPLVDLPIVKPCGGFHADYGFRWLKKGAPLASALICFGCGEILLVGTTVAINADMTDLGAVYLKEHLKGIRALRPPGEQKEEMPQDRFRPNPPSKVEYKP